MNVENKIQSSEITIISRRTFLKKVGLITVAAGLDIAGTALFGSGLNQQEQIQQPSYSISMRAEPLKGTITPSEAVDHKLQTTISYKGIGRVAVGIVFFFSGLVPTIKYLRLNREKTDRDEVPAKLSKNDKDFNTLREHTPTIQSLDKVYVPEAFEMCEANRFVDPANFSNN